MSSYQVTPIQARSLGWGMIPCGPDKRPAASLLPPDLDGVPRWKPFQARLATDAEFERWSTARPALWGLITGKISRRITLDFDGDAGFATMKMIGLDSKTPHRKSPSGGYHFDFVYPGWTVKTLNCKKDLELGRRYPGMDIRGDGGYVCFSGCSEVGTYTWLRDPTPYPLDTLPRELREYLGLLQPPQTQPRPQGSINGRSNGYYDSNRVSSEKLLRDALTMVSQGNGRNNSGFWLAGQLRDNGYSKPDTASVMMDFRSRCPDTDTQGRRAPYTNQEVIATVSKVFEVSPREPWGLSTRSQQNGSSSRPPQQQRPEPPPPPNDPPEPDGFDAAMPVIITSSRQLREKSAECLNVLRAANHPPRLFVTGSRLVRVQEEDKQKTIADLDKDGLRGELTRVANFQRHNPRKKGDFIPEAPPMDSVLHILKLPPDEWEFPQLKHIVRSPVLRPDGSVLDRPGYDEKTKLYYAPTENLKIRVPDHPSQADVRKAMELYCDMVVDFPWADEASLPNFIAAALSPLVRPAIQGTTPMALFNAHTVGTGKSLLAECISIVTTGQGAKFTPAPKDPSEWRKLLTSILLEGRPLAMFDNVECRLDSSDLCLALTAESYSDRILGQSKNTNIDIQCSWIATGNNIQLGGDMGRRCYWIKLDAKVAKPFQRSGFKHKDLKEWVRDHRSELLSALLTVARGWFAAGKPPGPECMFGSFDHWTRTISGILHYAGLTGFLGNLDEQMGQADMETQQWEGFLFKLHEVFRGEPFLVKEIAEKVQAKSWSDESKSHEPTNSAMDLIAALPDELAEQAGWPKSFPRVLGNQFSQRLGRRYGNSGVYVERGSIVHKTQQWIIRGVEAA